MALRPVKTDVLGDICRSIALENYGFVYVDKDKNEIQSRYRSAEKSLLHTDSLTGADIKDNLQDIASDDSNFKRLRSGVYYYNTLGHPDDRVVDELTDLFRNQVVVTSEQIRSNFDLAVDDVDFFISELQRGGQNEQGLIKKITTGERDYYTIGPRLKEQTGEAGVEFTLSQRSSHGKISHDDLERVINVSATSDVIRYLETEGIITDLDGEYLVENAIDEYGEYLAGEIEEPISEAFESGNYVLPEEEFENVVENEISNRFDIIQRLSRDTERRVLEETRSAVKDQLGLRDDIDMVVDEADFDEYATGQARRIKEEIEADADPLPATQQEYMEAAAPIIEELQAGKTPEAAEYIRDGVEDRLETLVGEEFEVN